MNSIFMNSENSRTSKYHVLILKLTDKIDLRTGEKNVLLYQILVFTIHGKMLIIIINLRYQLQHGIMNFNYLMDHI